MPQNITSQKQRFRIAETLPVQTEKTASVSGTREPIHRNMKKYDKYFYGK